MTPARPTRFQQISPEAASMLSEGESGRFEFKRDADDVSAKVLAALANWVALDEDRDAAHLLVGVDEQEDRTSGLTIGVPFGLSKGLERSVARMQDLASRTMPVPVDIFVVEEAVTTETPFLRVEVRPTAPPHYDAEGRRQTRLGRSTRPLTDDELLQLYLDREAGAFARRFRAVGDELQTAVGAVGGQLHDINVAITDNIASPLRELRASTDRAIEAASSAEDAAGYAGSAAGEASDDVRRLERSIGFVERLLGDVQAETATWIAGRVSQQRRQVWFDFSLDTYERESPAAEKLTNDLKTLLSEGISPNESLNAWELTTWERILAERKTRRDGRGTMKWWREQVEYVRDCRVDPAYAPPDFPDLRGELRQDFTAAADDPDSLSRRYERDLKS